MNWCLYPSGECFLPDSCVSARQREREKDKKRNFLLPSIWSLLLCRKIYGFFTSYIYFIEYLWVTLDVWVISWSSSAMHRQLKFQLSWTSERSFFRLISYSEQRKSINSERPYFKEKQSLKYIKRKWSSVHIPIWMELLIWHILFTEKLHISYIIYLFCVKRMTAVTEILDNLPFFTLERIKSPS